MHVFGQPDDGRDVCRVHLQFGSDSQDWSCGVYRVVRIGHVFPNLFGG